MPEDESSDNIERRPQKLIDFCGKKARKNKNLERRPQKLIDFCGKKARKNKNLERHLVTIEVGNVIEPLIDIVINFDAWEKLDFNAEEIAKIAIKATLNEFDGEKGVIALLLTDDDEIQELNKLWRGHDKPTNVLSFEHVEGFGILGDIAISLSYCQREAFEQNKSLKNHFTHLLVHGVLHLLGYDHELADEANEMEDLEREILEKLGICDPYLIGNE